jgi:hypothetical protein
MSSDTENHDHNTGTEDKIYDDLEKLIDSVDAEERELKVSLYVIFILFIIFKLLIM